MQRSALARLQRRARVLAGVTILFTVLQVVPANAHTLYEYWEVASEPGMCVMGYSEMSHGNGNGLAYQSVHTKDTPGFYPCYYRYPRWAYQHAMSMVVYYYNPIYQREEPCFGTPWTIQNSKTDSWIGYNVNVACGANTTYFTWSYNYARQHSTSAWIGQGQGSGGSHWLPA